MTEKLVRIGTLWYAMKQIWRTKKRIKMASNIDIQKKCEWCGVIFTAHKTSTAYCSHRCANLAYKERVRKKRVQEFQLKFDEEAKPHSEKEFLTPTEVSGELQSTVTYSQAQLCGHPNLFRHRHLHCIEDANA